MSASRSKIQVTPEVLAFAKDHGLSKHDLEDMWLKAALVSHERGNRRFHDWVLDIQGKKILRMTDVTTGVSSQSVHRGQIKLAPGEFVMYEECSTCRGDGCPCCNNSGEVPVVRKHQSNRIGAMQ